MLLTLASDSPVEVHDPAQASALVRKTLEASAHDHPLIVSDDALWDLHVDVGLSAHGGFIQVQASSRLPPYWVTATSPPRPPANPPTIAFFLNGRHHTEIPVERLLPADVLWTVLDTLLEQGTRSREVGWEQV